MQREWLRAGRLRSALVWLHIVPIAALASVPEPEITDLVSRASSSGEVRIIVQLDVPHVPEGLLTAAAAIQQRQAIAVRQRAVAEQVQPLGAREIRRFRHIPFSLFAANANGIRALGRLSMVTGMQEDMPELPVLVESATIIGAPAAWTEGYNGAGQVIAVLDTGVDLSHAFFGAPGKVVAEACYSTGDGGLYESLCPGGANVSLAPGSGNACPTDVTGCDHGTHVAGIALGDDGASPQVGIAHGARLISIQVFSNRVCQVGCQDYSGTAETFPSDQILALEQLYEWRDTYPIAVVNMSLGGFLHDDQATCDANNEARKAAIDNLRSVGIATVIATGNSGERNAMFQPACISSAVSVAATTDDDSVASFSNIAPFISLLAPGVGIVSAARGGGMTSMNGTSMATPHVAGAWTILRQATPATSVDGILALLQSTGTLVDDTRTGGTVTGMARIDVEAALNESTSGEPEMIFTDGFEDID